MTITELLNDALKNFKDRIKSPFYSTFIIAWCITNWKIIYVTLFCSEEYIFKTTNGLNKVNFIESFYNKNWYFIYNFIPLPSLQHWMIKPFFLPLIAVFTIHYGISKIDIMVFKKNEENIISKEKEKNRIRKESIEEEIQVKEKEKEIKILKKSEEEEWDEEYDMFLSKTNNSNQYLVELKYIIYEKKGIVFHDDDIPVETIAVLHANNLIEDPSQTKRKIILTKKGQAFLSRFIKNSPQPSY